MRSVINESIEVGNREKHIIEYRFNAWSGAEEVLDNGKPIYSKHMFSFGIDRVFEIGETEKIKVRIKHSFFEWLCFKVKFEVSGQPVVSEKPFSKSTDSHSIFWLAKIDSIKSANSAIVPAIAAGVISITSTLVIWLLSLRKIEVINPEVVTWIEPIFMAFLTAGLFRKNRTCAIMLFVYFLISKIILFPQMLNAQFLGFMIISIGFLFAFAQGIRGTFAYHRLKGTKISSKNVTVKSILGIVYGILFAFFGMVSFVLVTNNVEGANEAAFGNSILLSFAVGLFLAVLGLLPWTSGKPMVVEEPAPEIKKKFIHSALRFFFLIICLVLVFILSGFAGFRSIPKTNQTAETQQT